MNELELVLREVYNRAPYLYFCGCAYKDCNTNELRGRIMKVLEIPLDDRQKEFDKCLVG